MKSNTGWTSLGELEITPSTSDVAISCSSASSRSWVSLATFACRLAPRPRTAFGASRRLDVTALWRSDLAGLLPALERRRIAHPKGLGPRRFSKWDYSRDLRLAKWVSIKLRCKIPELRISGRSHAPGNIGGAGLEHPSRSVTRPVESVTV